MGLTYLYEEGLIFCAIMMILLLTIEMKNFAAPIRAKKYFQIMWSIILLELFLDIFWIYVDGQKEYVLCNKILETVYLAIFPFISSMWIGYLAQMFDIAPLKLKWVRSLNVLLNSLSAFIVVLSWKYGLVYFLDESGAYNRGVLAFLPVWLMHLGFAFASIATLVTAIKTTDLKKKPLLFAHAAFPIPTIILGIVQMYMPPGVTTIYLGAVLSLVILFYFARKNEKKEVYGMDTDAIFRRNEDEANQFTEVIVIVSFFGLIIDYMINSDSFTYDNRIMYGIIYVAIAGVMVITSVMLNHSENEKYFRLRKYLIISCMIFILGGIHVIFSEMVYVAIPLVMGLACRYFDKKMLNITSLIMACVLIIIGIVSFKYLGIYDVNMIELSPGTKLTIPMDSTWIDDAINDLISSNPLVQKEYAYNYIMAFIFEYLMMYMLFSGINLSGRRMLESTAKNAKERAIAEEDLAIANHIQTSMLPLNFDDYSAHEELNIYAIMNAALEVGGDFYDFFSIDDEKVCFLIGDVSGKGIPAALFMAKAQTTIKGLSAFDLTPAQILERTNNILNERNEEMFFVTIWIGILNIKTGELSYAVAGHNPPLIYRKDGDYEYMESRTDIIDADNIAVGVMPDMKYSDFSDRLNPGDKILLYTDGVTDAMNNLKEQFGEDRLKDYLNVDVVSSPRQTIEGLMGEISKFAEDEPQFDDITIMSVEFKKYR